MDRNERRDLKRHILDACVKSADTVGHGSAFGVLRGTLFLAEGPMSLDALAEETGYSKTTVRSSMKVLENLGLAKRVVSPGDKRFRYVMVTDHDQMRSAIMANMKDEVRLILTALDMTEKEIEDRGLEAQGIQKTIDDAKSFYRQTDRLLDLMSRHSTEELLEILDKARS